MSLLPLRDVEYLESHNYLFDEQEFGGQKGVILKQLKLPNLKYDSDLADVLFLLPSGYPDSPPDMFFANPWLKLRSVDRFPRAADQPFPYANISWQRWSRHSDQWRPGRDGIWTMIKRMEHALEIAE